MDRRKKIMTAVTVGVFVAVVICAVYIAANCLGVVDGYDFGAGAYYYADIPGYENLINEDSYKASVPVWVHIVLFLAWGWLMYRIWNWIDRK